MKLAQTLLLVMSLSCCPGGASVRASKPDQRPLKSLALPGKQTVLVRYAPNALGEYNPRDGKLVRTYAIDSYLRAFAASADEKSLVMAGRGGTITLWDLRTGEKRWGRGAPDHPDVRTYWDVSFSHDGASLAIAVGGVIVLDARSGAVKRVITLHKEITAMSTALSPDGSVGMASSLLGELWAFDVATGKVEKTGRKGFRPVRYSSDGKHVACRTEDFAKENPLQVVSVAKGYPARRVGDYWGVEYLQPTADGAFYHDVRLKNLDSAGYRYDPASGEAKQLWYMPSAKGVTDGGASCPRMMVSVSTDYRYRTQITNLRTWEKVVIDNSERYQEDWVSASFRPNGKKTGRLPSTSQPTVETTTPWWLHPSIWLLAAGIALVGWALWRRSGRRVPTESPPEAEP